MALNNSFSSQAMRDLNKFKLYCDGKLIFDAWTNTSLSFNMGLKDASLFDNSFTLGGTVGTALAVASQIGALSGTSYEKYLNNSGLSFETKNLYLGSSCLTQKVECHLLLRDDYQTDIADPLNTLMEYFAPELGDSTTDSNGIVQKFNSFVKEAKLKAIRAAGDISGDLGQIATNIFDNSHKFLGDVKITKLPKAFQNASRLDVELGSWRIEKVKISNIQISMPPAIYKNPKGGKPIPDHAKVSMDITSLRPVHTKTIDFNL